MNPTTDGVYTPKPGFVSLQIENNHSESHQLTVTVEQKGGEQLLDKSLTLKPQDESEFNDVLSIPEEGSKTYEIHAEGVGNQSVTEVLTITAGGEFQTVYVTINGSGVVGITQRTEPSEPITTTKE